MRALTVVSEKEPMARCWLDVVTKSRANEHVHWSKTAALAARHRLAARLMARAVFGAAIATPRCWVVRVVRVSPRKLDSHDNLGASLKAVIDGVADALGVDDRDSRVDFVVDQEKGKMGVLVELYEP